VWALAVSKDEKTIVSGAADSVITFWEDCTEEKEIEKERKRAETVSKWAQSLLSSVICMLCADHVMQRAGLYELRVASRLP
jgi:hypothetical protein